MSYRSVPGLIDLHLHLDGSLSLKAVRELASMQGIPIPDSDTDLMRRLTVGDDCHDLNEYLGKFSFPLSLLQTKEAITFAVHNLLDELSTQDIMYAEIRFAPQLHMEKGLTQAEVVRAAVLGLADAPIPARLILCCMRQGGSQELNIATIHTAAEFLGKGVVAVDLAGAEALFPTQDFIELFTLADSLGIPYTIHAGEAEGPDSIWKAILAGAKRIGHGVRCIEDSDLMKHLRTSGITLELCPTSNLNTRIFPLMSKYPIHLLLQNKVLVTINTDNMMVSNTTLKKEFEKLDEALFLSDQQIRDITFNSIDAAFCDEPLKDELRMKMYTYKPIK